MALIKIPTKFVKNVLSLRVINKVLMENVFRYVEMELSFSWNVMMEIIKMEMDVIEIVMFNKDMFAKMEILPPLINAQM